MKVKLNNKKYEIKSATQLTVKEYLQLIEFKFTGEIDYVLKYLSTTLDVRFSDIVKYNIANSTLIKILAYIGTIEPYQDVIKNKFPKEFYYKGVIHDTNKFDIYPVGVRWLIESKRKFNNVEHSIYLLSILTSKELDRGQADDNYNDLLELNYNRVLPLAAFFLRNLQGGTMNEKKFSPSQIKKYITNILAKLKRLQTKD